MILVHLLDQNSVTVQHRLNLSKIMVQAVPHLGVAGFLGGGGFGLGLGSAVVGNVSHAGIGGRGGGTIIRSVHDFMCKLNLRWSGFEREGSDL